MKSIILLCFAFILISAVSVQSQSDCPQICPAIYSPVCASDGGCYREYASECTLRAANCKADSSLRLINNGPCPRGVRLC